MQASAPVQTVEAVVRVAQPTGRNGKQFLGVRLEQADGAQWVVAYGPEGWLRAFDGQTVVVTGSPYEPTGQALAGVEHLRIATLRVKVEQPGAGPLLGVGPEQTLVGRFLRTQGPAGSKNEGLVESTFVARDGNSYLLEGWPEGQIVYDAPVEITARAVEPDMSYRARRGGDYLWVVGVRAL